MLPRGQVAVYKELKSTHPFGNWRRSIGEFFENTTFQKFLKVCLPFLVVGLLIVHVSLAISSIQKKSNTFDETGHLTSGYIMWKYNEYRFNAESGNFFHRIAALPLLAMDLNEPDRESLHWRRSDPWTLAHQFFYMQDNPAEKMLWWGRCMNIGLSALFGLLIFVWASRIFGKVGGLLSLFIYVLSPTILAHCRLATVDCALAFFMLLTLGQIWSILHKVTLLRIITLGLAASALILTKFSGLLILPVAVGLLLIRLIVNKPLICQPPRSFKRLYQKRLQHLLVLASAAIVVGIIIYGSIWAAYGFRYKISPDFDPRSEQLFRSWETVLDGSGGATPMIETFKETHFLPEGFLYGLAYTLVSAAQRRSFLLGEYSTTGFPHFFPVLFAFKTPLSILLLIATGIIGLFAARSRKIWYKLSPLLVLLGIYLVASLTTNLNIGHRHILLLYPILFILAAGTIYCTREWILRSILFPILLVMVAIETQSISPHYLSFFNLLSGGPSQAYKVAVDSSLDWGQDLPLVKDWIHENPGGAPFYLAYFGTSSPSYYGIEARFFPAYPGFEKNSFDIAPLTPGTYIISATELQNVYGKIFDKWKLELEQRYQHIQPLALKFIELQTDPEALQAFTQKEGENRLLQLFRYYESLRFTRLCNYLRTIEPDASLGNSILVYRLTESDLEARMELAIQELLKDK